MFVRQTQRLPIFSSCHTNQLFVLVTIAALFAGFEATALAAKLSKKQRFYLVIEKVRESDASTCKLGSKAKTILEEELKKRDSFLLGSDLPGIKNKKNQAEKPLSEKELTTALKKAGIKGYRVMATIPHCSHRVVKPKPGKVYKTLAVEVAIKLHAESVPSDQLALAGNGSAEVATEINRVDPRELNTLRREALQAAIKQAAENLEQKMHEKPKLKRKKRRRKKKSSRR